MRKKQTVAQELLESIKTKSPKRITDLTPGK